MLNFVRWTETRFLLDSLRFAFCRACAADSRRIIWNSLSLLFAFVVLVFHRSELLHHVSRWFMYRWLLLCEASRIGATRVSWSSSPPPPPRLGVASGVASYNATPLAPREPLIDWTHKKRWFKRARSRPLRKVAYFLNPGSVADECATCACIRIRSLDSARAVQSMAQCRRGVIN